MPSKVTAEIVTEWRDEEPDYNVFCKACGCECWGSFKRLYGRWNGGSLFEMDAEVCASCADIIPLEPHSFLVCIA